MKVSRRIFWGGRLPPVSIKAFLYGPVAATATVALSIVAFEFNLTTRSQDERTREMLLADDAVVQNFLQEWHELPRNQNELRLHARKLGQRMNAYDAWGERIEYLPLDRENYSLRSFAADGLQNRPNETPDISVLHWGPDGERGLKYNSQAAAEHRRPSAVLLAGASDDEEKWTAKIFLEPQTGTKRLVVRSERQKNLYMVAIHDRVEEFFWLPNQQKIVFTASHSSRYTDGLYVWDLLTDETEELFTLEQQQAIMGPNSAHNSLYLALSFVSATNPPQVGVFMVPARQQKLNPKTFFQPKNLHVFILDKSIKHIQPPAEVAKNTIFHDTEFLGSMTVIQDGAGSALQKAWLAMPLGGDWEKRVLEWQDFTAANLKSVLAPYAILGLSMFYEDAAAVAEVDSKEKKAFIELGAEMGKSLSASVGAPGYLQAIGFWQGDPKN